METQIYTNSAVTVDFVYDDADSYQNEIAELYSYSENSEFKNNFMDFKTEAESLNLSAIWQTWSSKERGNFAMREIDHLENCDDKIRMRAARCVLYLVQGCWAEVKTIEEQQYLVRENVKLLFKVGLFQSMISLLNMELEKVANVEKIVNETNENYMSSIDSSHLRVIFNVLYTIVETVRQEQLSGKSDYSEIVEECIIEMNNYSDDGGLTPIKLLNMVIKFCNGTAKHFPIKKILLLAWKISLLILGGTNVLRARKNELRINAGLEASLNDTLNVSKLLKPCIMSSEDTPTPKRCINALKRSKALWDAACDNMEASKKSVDLKNKLKQVRGNRNDEDIDIPENQLTYEQNSRNKRETSKNGLPFESKVRLYDIDSFLQKARQKYFGYNIENDTETIVGLPFPIQESVRALKRHLYISLSEKQIKDEQCKENMLYKEETVESTPTELLYQALLPNFRKYLTDLLRIMLSASPSSKLTTNSLNSRIVASLLPKNSSNVTVFSTCIQLDVIRHKEIVVKAITAILLLYLKHLRLNHIYQYEYMSQLLTQCSFIKVSLKLFAPVIPEYVIQQTTSVTREFPMRLIQESLEEYSSDLIHSISAAPESPYKWRNLFACINLMRILNKLVKWKSSRILSMVSLKSSNAFINMLQIRQPLMQIYVLKLLKMQARHLGRYWRRINLKVMTAIYTKVRHRFNDDWAYGYDAAAKFWNAQNEENELRKRISSFNNRRYPHITIDNESFSKIPKSTNVNYSSNTSKNTNEQLNNGHLEFSKSTPLQCINYLLSNATDDMDSSGNYDLSEDFKENYEVWLNEEVFSQNIDWDST